MTRRRVADEHYGLLCRRIDEVKRRVDEGNAPFDATMEGLQILLQGGDNPLVQEETEPRIWRTEVDYVTPIDEQIEKFGQRRRVDLRVPWLGDEYFPSPGGMPSAVLNMEFKLFERPVPLSEAPASLKKHGYRGLTAHELVGFAVNHDRLRPQMPTPAVNQVMCHVSGGHYVACLEAAGDIEAFNVMIYGKGIALSRYLAVKV
ncbi:hypothetical protein HY633_00890 [Candidatus Uhrbacteria bacterium]|nr:hypothetical protein [Candidatus Uhrbacteria bacterium]